MNLQNGLEDVHGCNEWNTCYEEKINKTLKTRVGSGPISAPIKPTRLNDVKNQDIQRQSTGFEELDRVLGGGIVKGSLILLGRRTRDRKIYFNSTTLR